MFEKLGATVVSAPVIQTLPVGESVDLRRATEGLIAAPPDYLVANTGVGMRSWLGLAATWGIDGPLHDALAATRIVARGPKAVGAVAAGGWEIWWRSDTEQLESVKQRILDEPLAGKKVAVQLHGDDRQDLTDAFTVAGAEVVELQVYRWILPEDSAPAKRLIESCVAGQIDALTFTSAPAVRNLLDIADGAGMADRLLETLERDVIVVCIGPVCAAVAREVGIGKPLVPDRWRLGSLVATTADALLQLRHRYEVGEHELVLQGSVAVVDGTVVKLTVRESGVLARLAVRPGATVTRAALLEAVWGDPDTDPHVLETTVARLRAKLAPAGDAIETAVRRGYRLSAPLWTPPPSPPESDPKNEDLKTRS